MGILANVMSAASEAEAAALLTNMKEGVIQHIALDEMQWPQPPTPLTVDNSMAVGLAWDTIKANKSWAMDMRLHWIQDRAQQCQFLLFGPQENSTKRITLPNCMPPFTIVACVLCIYISPPSNPAQLSLANLSCEGVLDPGSHPRSGNPDVTGIPQVNYSTSQQQFSSMPAEVAYLTKTQITIKPVARTN